jgi:hypothetical protein
MLTCQEVTELSTELLEGTLSWRLRWQVRIHLAMCRLCRRYIEQLRLTIAALRRLRPEGRIDRERLRREALAEFRAWKEHQRS